MKNRETIIDIFFTLIFLSYCLLIIDYSLSFEIGWNEQNRIWNSFKSLLGHFIRNSDLIGPLPSGDHGPLIAVLVRLFFYITDDNVKFARLLFSALYLSSYPLLYYYYREKIGRLTLLMGLILTGLNIHVILLSAAVSSYALFFFTSIIFYLSHFYFNGSKKSILFHAISSFIALVSFYSSIIPIIVSIFLIYYKQKSSFLKNFKYYIPLMSYGLFKLVIIINYRLIKRNNFNEINFAEHTERIVTDLLEFFYIYNSISFLQIGFKIILIFYIINLFRSNKNIQKFTKLNLIIVILTYFLFNYIGAEEIRMKYYIIFLPLFYITLVRYVLSANLIKYNIIRAVIIVLIFCNSYQYFQSYMKNNKFTPYVSAVNSIIPILKVDDKVCFAEEPRYLAQKSLVRKIGMTLLSRKNKDKFSYHEYVKIGDCRNLFNMVKNNMTLYIVTKNNEAVTERMCVHYSINNCNKIINKEYKLIYKKEKNRRDTQVLVYKVNLGPS